MMDTLDFSSEWKCIVSVPYLMKHVNHSWCHIDLCHFYWNFIILQVEINSFVCFVMYKFVLWMSILTYVFVWVFVMYMFVRLTIHILMVLSCTCLYEWLSISFEWVFVMYMFVLMTIHIIVYGFSSWTFLYNSWVQLG